MDTKWSSEVVDGDAGWRLGSKSRARRSLQTAAKLIVGALLGLVVVGALSDAAIAATTASLSVSSISRIATNGDLAWDATATSAGLWSSGGSTTCWNGSSCSAVLQARLTTGSIVDLQSDPITQPQSGSGNYSHRFTGTAASLKINALRVSITGSGTTVSSSWKTVTDPYPTKSITIGSSAIGREALHGNLTYDVTTSAVGFSMPDGQCQTIYCAVALEVKRSDGSVLQIDTVAGINGQPYPMTNHFVGEARTTKVTALRVVIYSERAGVADLASAWKTVTDPYPTPSVSITASSFDRRARDGVLLYEISASARSFAMPDGVCGDQTLSCFETLEFRHADGSVEQVENTGNAIAQDYPYIHTFSGELLTTKVSAFRTVFYPQTGTGAALASAWTSVTDPYPPTTFDVTSAQIKRNKNGHISFDITTSASGFWLPDAQCGSPADCYEYVAITYESGDVEFVDTGSKIGGEAYPFVAHIAGSSSDRPDGYGGTYFSPVTSLQVVIGSSNPAGPPLVRPLVVASVPYQRETRGGSNAAENACPCAHGDPIDSLTGYFAESVTDLALPGVGPALASVRTYSSQDADVDGPFGHGWAPGFAAHLEFPSNDVVEVVQENGATVKFTKQANGTYLAPSRVLATLAYTSSTSSWTFVRRATETLRFNAAGQLTQLRDPHATAVSLTRDATTGNVTKLSATGGRWIAFAWDPSGSGHILSASDSAGRAVSYVYDAAGDLTAVTAPGGGTTSFGYDSAHRRTSITRPRGGVTTNAYDADGRVTKQTDPVGGETRFSYDDFSTTITAPDGVKTTETYNGGLLMKKVEDVDGVSPRVSSFTYDAANSLATETNPRGRTTTYTYDVRGNVLAKTDPVNHTTTFTYNSLNKVLSVKDALGKTSTATYNSTGDQLTALSRAGVSQSWTYNSNGTPATWVDGRGKTTTYAYNTAGLQTSVTDADSRTSTRGYNAAGFVTSQKNAANEVTLTTRDAVGRPLMVKTPGLHGTTYTYDADGNLKTVTDARGKVTTNTYDLAGHLISSVDPLNRTTSTTYDELGRVKTTTDGRGKVTTRSYTPFGELKTVTDPNNHVTSYAYDKTGNLTSTTLPSGAQSSATYDDADQLASTTDARGKTTTITRDANGQVTATKDPLSRITAQAWTDDGQLKTTTLPDSSTEQRTYTATGALATYTNPDGLITSYTYSNAGLPTGKTEPGTMTTGYTYDAAGRLKTTTTPDGHVVTLSYDADGNVALSHSDVTGSTDVTYGYNNTGQRTAMTDVTGTSTYTYDDAGQLTSTTNGANAAVGYGYNTTGQVTSITYPGNKTVAYTYDPAGQLSTVTDWQNRVTNLDWTANGQLHSQATPNGVTQTWTHNANGQTTDITVAGSSTLANYSYSWDDAGQLTSDSTTDPLGTGVNHTYTYDAVSQLAGVQGAGPAGPVTATSGGQLTKTNDGTTYAYNAAQQVTSSTPTSGSATTYAYDGNGSRTSASVPAAGVTPASTTSYSYDRDGNLKTVALPSGATISYTADGDGLRQSRTKTSTQAFTWNTQSDLPLLLDDGDHHYIYGVGTTPIAQVDNNTGSIEYLHGDLIGSTRLITSATGAASGSYRYDAYGAVTGHSGASTVIGYSGNWTDPDSGLLYLRARDYDPATGQFIQVDPALSSTRQPYAYVTNDPLAQTDPTGLCGNFPAANMGCDTRPLWAKVFDSAPANWLGAVLTSGPTGEVSNFVQGIGNGATFGATGLLRQALVPQYACVADQSGFYAAGTVGGAVALGVVTGGAGTAARGAAGIAERSASELPTVVFSRARAPEIAANFDRAVGGGAPTQLTRASAAVRDANRRAALRGQTPAGPGRSLDEYPFASSEQGGAGARVASVPQQEQAYQGGVLGQFYTRHNIGHGDKFNVRFGE